MDAQKIIVVGAGPAGMMAAIRASQLKEDVTLIEKNPALGKKLLLSGKGRCNLTNACDLNSFLKRFSKNGDFLRDAFKIFFNRQLMDFFEERGLKLKIERQLRVFPATDNSGSVVSVLKKELEKNKVNMIFNANVKGVSIKDKGANGILLDKGRLIPADKVILATGGISYKFTGSTGEGLGAARRLGHSIVDLMPGLVPLEAKQGFVKSLQGLTLKNVRLAFTDGKRSIESDIGELLFTDFGISGPLVLSLSGKLVDWLQEGKNVSVRIDLKPALSKEQLEERLLKEFKVFCKKNIRNILKNFLPQRLIDVFLGASGIAKDKKANQITQSERQKIVVLLKSFCLDISKTRPIDEAMVTRGGVSVNEINPRTMESRLIKGLYFAGEMIDVDADTGGFNLQAAFSTGYLAGEGRQ